VWPVEPEPDHRKVRDFKLDRFKWIKDESLEDADELPEPEELATEAIAELERALKAGRQANADAT
jgi:type I restriction enzyme M protein